MRPERFAAACIAGLLVAASPNVYYQARESTIMNVTDTITRKTRIYKGKLQYRRWNVTRKVWEDSRWITIRPSSKKGWVKEGKKYYYYSPKTGKLVTNQLIKIGKYKYGFDKKGCSVRDKIAKIDGFVYRFDKKGHALIQEKKERGTYYCVDKVTKKLIYAKNTLRIVQKRADHFLAKNTTKTGDSFVIFRRQIKAKMFRSLRKGDKIQVFSDGRTTESSWLELGNIYKITKEE